MPSDKPQTMENPAYVVFKDGTWSEAWQAANMAIKPIRNSTMQEAEIMNKIICHADTPDDVKKLKELLHAG